MKLLLELNVCDTGEAKGFTVMTTSFVVAAQGLLLIVQRRV